MVLSETKRREGIWGREGVWGYGGWTRVSAESLKEETQLITHYI